MQVFGYTEIDREKFGLGKIRKNKLKLDYFCPRRHLIRRFSRTNQIHSCGFESGVIWGKSVERCAVPESKKQLICDFLREKT
jgi:hypothetical protein